MFASIYNYERGVDPVTKKEKPILSSNKGIIFIDYLENG